MVTMPLPRPRWARARAAWLSLAGWAATVTGTAVRLSRGPSRLLPGLAGAGMVAYGAALVYTPAGFIVGGGFLLWFGSEINRTPPVPDTTRYESG